MKLTISFVVLLLVQVSFSQSYTGDQIKQGYAQFGDQVTFLFDQTLYEVKPKKVFVTGEFRGWDTKTDTKAWELSQTGTVWALTIENIDFSIIQPNTKFKFRMDDGKWLDPPTASENVKGTDLVFLMSDNKPPFIAELRSEYLIWAEINVDRPLSPSAYRITDALGNEIKVAGVLPNGAASTLITPAEPLNKKRVYFLEIPDKGLKAHCSFDGWFRENYSTKELGANIKGGRTSVRLFAPRADLVKLYLYNEKDDENPTETIEMKEDDLGVWEAFFDEDLHGTYYDFTIHGADDPGNHFYRTVPQHINDPYARVSDDTWGKARIWRYTTPATPLANGIPKMEDVIAYEVHIQDFTDQLPIPKAYKGRIPGMTATGLKNKRGQKIGFDYLVDLGINVVHLMPVQEYVHFPTDDWKASFHEDEYMIMQGVSDENYQWGYRTSFAMAVEARYRSLGKEPGYEREEFRDLVQAFHDKGIAVIIDIVPNHTAENMDANEWYFNFNAIDKQYYYRTKNFEHIGAYGNEVKMENRPMTQRWIIDQCKHWIDEFGIDGFRIDLAGQIDEQTLKALKDAIGHDKIVYGEAWIGSNDPNYEENPEWDWYKEDAPITFFQDDSRNAYKGPVFELKDPLMDRGWPGGKFEDRTNVMKGLSARFPTDKTPVSGISYLDIHDNFALADQFGEGFDGRTNVLEDTYKMAVTLLYTTLGPLVTHGGSEIMRSKADAPLKEVVKTTKAGYSTYMHGYRDTYNHRYANQFKWELVGQTPTSKNQNDYANMFAFWRGMNAFRLSALGKVFRQSKAVPDHYYQWILPEDESMLGYVVDEKIAVLLNANSSSKTFENVRFPQGKWKLIGTTERIDHVNGVKAEKAITRITGRKSQNIQVDGKGLLIWKKE